MTRLMRHPCLIVASAPPSRRPCPSLRRSLSPPLSYPPLPSPPLPQKMGKKLQSRLDQRPMSSSPGGAQRFRVSGVSPRHPRGPRPGAAASTGDVSAVSAPETVPCRAESKRASRFSGVKISESVSITGFWESYACWSYIALQDAENISGQVGPNKAKFRRRNLFAHRKVFS